MDNKQKNTYVKKELTKALIRLMEDSELKDISICELVSEAQVSRNSFYRNYENISEIIREHIYCLLQIWNNDYHENNSTDDIPQMMGSFFQHFINNKRFYLLVYKRGLSYLILNNIKEMIGPKAEQDNENAYYSAFIAHGLYGWIDEWFARGMQESATTMSELIISKGIKK